MRFKTKYLIISCLLIIFVVGISFLLSKEKSHYQIESRLSNVLATKIDVDNGFHTIGWIRVQGTNIDYPIIRSDDVHANFPVQLESFSWSLNHDDQYHNHIILMGHNIFNLSATPKSHDERFHRFEELMNFVYYDFVKDNQFIQLTIDGKEYLYRVFAVGFLNESDLYSLLSPDDYSKKDLNQYYQLMDDINIYNYDVDVNENDDIITLSTCTRLFGDGYKTGFYVSGRLLRKEESTYLSSVRKSKKYQEVEKIWKGDVTDNEDYA